MPRRRAAPAARRRPPRCREGSHARWDTRRESRARRAVRMRDDTGGGAARRGEPGIGGAEERDGGDADRGRQMRDARVAAHEARQPREEPRQERGPVAPDERRRRPARGGDHRIGGLAVGRRLPGARGSQVRARRAARRGARTTRRARASRARRRRRGAGRRCAAGRRARPRRAARRLASVGLPVSGERPRGRRVGHVDAERLEEPRVLVDLVLPRIGQRDRVGEEQPARVRVEADAAPGAPAPGGQRRLERVREEDGEIGTRAAPSARSNRRRSRAGRGYGKSTSATPCPASSSAQRPTSVMRAAGAPGAERPAARAAP